MAFKLDQSPSYRWPVKVTLLGEDGTPAESEFQVDFKRLSQSELEKLIEDFRSENAEVKVTDKTFCQQYVLGWDGIQETTGGQLLFSPVALDQMLDIIGVQAAIVRAFFDSVRKGQEKNSVTQPDPGLTQQRVLN